MELELIAVDADFVDVETVAVAAAGSMSGDPKTPPNRNDPSTLIPAVCQPMIEN